ncbi:MAG: STAS/SEC14 domain-containing protein [Candidatus Competibacterales bacterium]|nr:STAS/SEC14 domain-containing protein [Candidatus Competibacterales bacterium]
MIRHELDTCNAILRVRPIGPFKRQDIEEVNRAVDPFIRKHGALSGLVIETTPFPYWQNLPSMIEHFHFTRDQHRKLKRIAVITRDADCSDMVERIRAHFDGAAIRCFTPEDRGAARSWAEGWV